MDRNEFLIGQKHRQTTYLSDTVNMISYHQTLFNIPVYIITKNVFKNINIWGPILKENFGLIKNTIFEEIGTWTHHKKNSFFLLGIEIMVSHQSCIYFCFSHILTEKNSFWRKYFPRTWKWTRFGRNVAYWHTYLKFLAGNMLKLRFRRL